MDLIWTTNNENQPNLTNPMFLDNTIATVDTSTKVKHCQFSKSTRRFHSRTTWTSEHWLEMRFQIPWEFKPSFSDVTGFYTRLHHLLHFKLNSETLSGDAGNGLGGGEVELQWPSNLIRVFSLDTNYSK